MKAYSAQSFMLGLKSLEGLGSMLPPSHHLKIQSLLQERVLHPKSFLDLAEVVEIVSLLPSMLLADVEEPASLVLAEVEGPASLRPLVLSALVQAFA